MSNAPLDRESLPIHTQDKLKSILAKRSAAGCTEDEIGFLNARRDYLTSEEADAFELNAKPAKSKKEDAEAGAEKPAKPAKTK